MALKTLMFPHPEGSEEARVFRQYAQLCHACEQGNLRKVERLIALAGDALPAVLAMTDDVGETVLHSAIESGSADIVARVIQAGVSVNQAGGIALAPLSLAVARGSTDVIDYLIQQGADINQQDKKTKRTPLMMALAGKRYDVAIHLVEKGAECAGKFRDKDGHSALDAAAICDHPPVFFRMVEMGRLAELGKTALEFAVQHNACRIAGECLEHSEYSRPMNGEGAAQIIANAPASVRQVLLSWRSGHAVEVALAGVEAESAIAARVPRSGGLSL